MLTDTPRVLVAQIGARRRYAVPRGLALAGCLQTMVTDACDAIHPWRHLHVVPRRLRPRPLRAVLDRHVDDIDLHRIKGCLAFSLSAGLGSLRGRDGESKANLWARQNEAFGTAVARLDWKKANTIYAFNGAALEIFQRARQLGLRCILDQTAAPWRYNTTLLGVERARWPGWEDRPADIDTEGRMVEREEQEWALADRIICGSSFVANAIRAVGGPSEKCRVVSYPLPDAPVHLPLPESHEGPLRVLYVGTLQLRKGIQYFCETASQLSDTEFKFRALGSSDLTPHAEALIRARIDWRGRVARHDVWAHYRWADVFLLPTLSEGSANVCWEALKTGTPVITTAAAGLSASSATIVTRDSSLIAAQLRALVGRPRSEGNICPRSVAEYGADLVRSMS